MRTIFYKRESDHYSPAGLAALMNELLAIDPALIVVEATANWHLGSSHLWVWHRFGFLSG
jgi:hypothetical protein